LSLLLGTVESGTARISELIQTVKEYTHMDQAPAQNVDIVRSLETTLSALAHLMQPAVRVERAYQPVPLLVNTMGNELNQVWTNIIENAIEAMRGEGELRLQTFREDGYVVVEVGDSGRGIPPEIQSQIFDPFFTTKDIGEGTGLGLNTAQTIVRKHGGSIQVNSRPGDTRFQVWLPCVEPAEF
jgi:signal transduction histidine kinase